MERYLALELLGQALGQTRNLPTKQELSKLIADAEVGLLISNNQFNHKILETGWYLFTIASIKQSSEIYGVERQRAAFQVSGHIFDIALTSGTLDLKEKRRLVFASQISYLKSQHQPNAIAIRKKHFKILDKYSVSPENYQDISLNCGIATLAFDIGYIYDATFGFEDQARDLAQKWNINSLFETPFGASFGLAIGCRKLVNFLIYGRDESLDHAKDYLRKAATCDSSYEDIDAIWMANLLLSLTDELYSSSVWKVLPPDVPYNVKRAFTLGTPRVLSLWPPQIDYLSNSNPFAEEAKFQFISTPTSGGKTLLSQVLIAHHLTSRLSSACYIAPTRSLCREVAMSMKERLRFLNLKSRIRETLEEFGLDEDDVTEPTVDILTPESLASLIRRNPSEVFSKYGLFVFDEVHAIGDPGRGWVLEQTIALLKTIGNEHNSRIIMISAVIGNRNHFISWLAEGNNRVLESHSNWRGPRRLNAIWNTYTNWQVERSEDMQTTARSVFNRRTYHKLYGQLTVRTSMTGDTLSAQTTQPIGELAMKYPINPNKGREVDSAKSLGHNASLLPLVELLAQRGPVLCIEATKRDTVSLAKAIAANRTETNSDDIRELVEFIEAKLSPEHPLSRVVKSGVAYHHGSLPNDIRTEIEKAVSGGIVKVLVATTTMTEGVNLPVQAVIISKVGSYQNNQEFLRYIKGSKMANAIGRAGRATQETEGCVVLFHKGQPSAETFKALDPDDQDKLVTSNLSSEDLLKEFSLYEESKMNSLDAVFECNSPILSGFFSFIWFYLYTISPQGDPQQESIDRFLCNTMAWLQGTAETKNILSSLTRDVNSKFSESSTPTRKLFATVGSKLGTTKTLREVFNSIKDDLTSDKSDIQLIKAMFTNSTLSVLLSVAEAPRKAVYDKRTGHRAEITIPLVEILEDWINGLSYPDLASKYLYDVADTDFRFEQLGDYISGYFDNFLPWIVGTILTWANELDEIEELLPVHLPGLIRGGVPNRVALTALHMSIYSRQLATSIATWKERYAPDISHFQIRSELQKYSISSLIELLGPSPSELRNLIEFLSEEKTELLSNLNEFGVCTIPFWPNNHCTAGQCRIDGPGTRSNYDIYKDDVSIGIIPTMFHVEIRTLIDSGIPFELSVTTNFELELSVDEFESAE